MSYVTSKKPLMSPVEFKKYNYLFLLVVCHFGYKKRPCCVVDFKVARAVVLPGLCVGLEGGLCNVVIQVLLREMSSPVSCSDLLRSTGIILSKTI